MSHMIPVPSGTKARYRDNGLSLDRLAGQVRIVGPIDKDGGAEMLAENGEVCDYRDAGDLQSDVFWKDFEPYEEPPAYGSLLLDGEHTSYRAIGKVNNRHYYIRQTTDGKHDMTSQLPGDVHYVYDANAQEGNA